MCPHCKQPMVAYELEGVEIDRCLDCGGTWLDVGELELIAELAGASTSSAAGLMDVPDAIRSQGRRCPRCGRRMEVITTKAGVRVTLDRCPNGHGLWFDHGEMQCLIGAAAPSANRPVAEFFAELYRHDLNPPSEGV